MSKAQMILDMIANQPRKLIRGPFSLDVKEVKGNEVVCDLVYLAKKYEGTIGYYQEEGVVWKFNPSLIVEGQDDDIWLDLVFEVIVEYKLGADVK